MTSSYISHANAAICLDCDSVYDGREHMQCPRCGTSVRTFVSTLDLHKSNLCQACGKRQIMEGNRMLCRACFKANREVHSGHAYRVFPKGGRS